MTKYAQGGLLAIALLLCGCLSMGTVQTADTLGKGHFQVAAEPGIYGAVVTGQGGANLVVPHFDVAFRYGGDEFVLMLRACDATRAVEVATRLRERLRAIPFVFSDGTASPVSFSAGTAAAELTEGFSAEGLVTRADTALYRAKARGRDCVERW